MQIRSGSLLIANPAYADEQQQGHVVYITESTEYSTMGLILNSRDEYSLDDLLIQKGINWPYETRVGIGGDYSPTCMIMLHTNEWYSSNTMPITNDLSISSDGFMLEKLETGNWPEWYKLFLGTSGWTPIELEQELRGTKPKWLLLANPSQVLIELADDQLWNNAVAEVSQDVFSNYI
jgi:putative transcriptional regulator